MDDDTRREASIVAGVAEEVLRQIITLDYSPRNSRCNGSVNAPPIATAKPVLATPKSWHALRRSEHGRMGRRVQARTPAAQEETK